MDFPWFPCGDERELHYSGSAIKKILQRRGARRRAHHRLPRQGERQDHAGLQEGADGRREEMRRRLAFMPAVDRTEIGVHARRDRIRRTLRRNFQEENFNT
jgi:hypothetical protein